VADETTGQGRAWPPPWVIGAIETWDVDSLVAQMHANAMARVFGQLVGNDEFAALTYGSIRENVHAMRRYIAGAETLTELELKVPVQLARRQAQLFTSQNLLQRSYRIGNQFLMRDWTGHLTQSAREQGIDDAEVVSALIVSTQRILAYHDFALGVVADEYTDQENALRRTGRQIRQQVVRDLLASDAEFVPGDLLRLLGYDLGLIHVAIEFPGRPEDETERLVPELCSKTDAAHALCISVSAAGTIVWLGRAKSWGGAQIANLAELISAWGIGASLTTPHQGRTGFRASYDEIQEMRALREFTGDANGVYSFADVQLETILVKDPNAARRFLAAELGPLSENAPTMAELRETILASFHFGTHTATAAHLFLHEHTVRNRLRKAEGLLGRRLSERPVELQAALRLRRMMSAAEDSGSGSVRPDDSR
jgi:hypothetical protein